MYKRAENMVPQLDGTYCYIFNEFPVCWFVLFWDVFTVPVNHP